MKVKMTKISKNPNSTIHFGDSCIGELSLWYKVDDIPTKEEIENLCELMPGKRCYVSAGGFTGDFELSFLMTTEVRKIIKKSDKLVHVKTKNSTYSIEVL